MTHTPLQIDRASLLRTQRLPLVSAKVARTLVERGEVDVIDARDLSAQLWVGHIPNALHLPWRALTTAPRQGTLVKDALLIERLNELGLSPSRPVLVYASWGEGWGEEARALWSLEYLGHQEVYVLEGGWGAWLEAGGARSLGSPAKRLPSHPSKGTPHSAHLKPSVWTPRPELRARTKDIELLLARGYVPIDTRTAQEFEGETPYGSPLGGHLKGAVHLPWESVLNGAHLLAPDALRTRLLEVGVDPSDLSPPYITYCTGGVRSAFVYLALRTLGMRNVRNYDGSWWAWSEELKARSRDAHE